MLSILPTELLLTVLDSSVFSHHDSTKIALTCRSFLPFARTRLYQFIQLEYYAQINGYALTTKPGTNQKSRGALVILRSNRLLRALVEKILIRGNTVDKPSQELSVGLVSQLLALCVNTSVLVLTSWQYSPNELEPVFAKTEKSRIVAGNSIKLSVHVEINTRAMQETRRTSFSPAPALQSFDGIHIGQIFAGSILANSEASLRALAIRLDAAPYYKKFANITTLYIRDFYLSEPKLFDAIHLFDHLATLLYKALLPVRSITDVVNALRQPLPPTLRSLSIEHEVDLGEAIRVVNALPIPTGFELLNFRRVHFVEEGVDLGPLKALCSGKGIRMTFGEVWNLWDQL